MTLRFPHAARKVASGWTALALLLLGCGAPNSGSRIGQAPVADVASAPAAEQGTSGQQGEPAAVAQKLIHTGYIDIELDDVPRGVHVVDSIAKEFGGTVTGNRVRRDEEEGRTAELVLRVPSARFADVLGALRRVGSVREEMDSTQDVTREYTDLTTRLAVKEQEVARLRAMLDTRGAKLSDVLAIERELTRAVTELEQLEGVQRYYDQQVALSTITVELSDHAVSRGSELLRPIRDALHHPAGVVGTSLAAVVYALALVIPWLILAFLGRWVFFRLRGEWRRRAAPRS